MSGAVLVPAPFGSPNYLELSGTSMAAAVTSGAVAAVLANENLTPDQVKARLMKTADKLPQKTYTIPVIDPTTGQTTNYTVQNDIFTVGAGYLDLGAALQAKGDPNFTIPANENAASPVAVPQFNSNGTVSVNLQNYLAVYGKDVFTVWGSDAFTVWGSDAFTVWGSDTFTVWEWTRSRFGVRSPSGVHPCLTRFMARMPSPFGVQTRLQFGVPQPFGVPLPSGVRHRAVRRLQYAVEFRCIYRLGLVKPVGHSHSVGRFHRCQQHPWRGY